MKLSNQAIATIMVSLQKCLLEQSDITEILRSYNFVKSGNTKRWGTKSGELQISNPPDKISFSSHSTGKKDN